jgi:hypothetical protein
MTPIDEEYGATETMRINPTGGGEPLGGKSPAELESEINQIRADMDSTLDAIERRFSPGEIVDRVLHDMKGGPTEFATNLGRAIRDNPVPSALVGIGVGWLLLSEAGVTEAAAEKTRGWKEAAARKGGELHEAEGGGMARARGKLRETSHALREKGHAVSERLHHTGDRLHQFGERARYRRARLTENASGLTRTIRDNPIPAAMACVGLGWLFMRQSGETDVAAAKTAEWKETGTRAASRAREKIQEKTASLSEGMHERRERLSEGMQEKRERLHEYGEKVREARGRCPKGRKWRQTSSATCGTTSRFSSSL